MATQTTLTVSYTLSPPEGTNTPPLLALTAEHAFAIEAEKTGKIGEYCEAVRKAIAAAKEKMGKELTAWRDAVGNTEAGKEKVAKSARTEEEEEEE